MAPSLPHLRRPVDWRRTPLAEPAKRGLADRLMRRVRPAIRAPGRGVAAGAGIPAAVAEQVSAEATALLVHACRGSVAAAGETTAP